MNNPHYMRHEDAVLGLFICSGCGLAFEAWDAAPDCPNPKEDTDDSSDQEPVG